MIFLLFIHGPVSISIALIYIKLSQWFNDDKIIHELLIRDSSGDYPFYKQPFVSFSRHHFDDTVTARLWR